MQNKKRWRIDYFSLIVIFVFLILLGVGGMLLHLGDLEIHQYGWEVEGKIVSYNVRGSSPGRTSTDHCVCKCEYRDDENGKYYTTTTSYSIANEVKSKDWCEEQIGKSIELVIDNYGHCMAKRDMTFDLVQWILLPRGIFITVGVVGIIVIVVKKFYFDKRKQLAKDSKDKICKRLDSGFMMDSVYCVSMVSFRASLNCKDLSEQIKVCGMSAAGAERFVNKMGIVKRKNVYWRGKVIQKNSKQYDELLKRAEVEQKKAKSLL